MAAALARASAPITTKKEAQQPRNIAVRTEKENSKTGKDAVIIFDIRSNSIVGNQVYDLNQTPKVGTVQNFDNYSAEFVGG